MHIQSFEYDRYWKFIEYYTCFQIGTHKNKIASIIINYYRLHLHTVNMEIFTLSLTLSADEFSTGLFFSIHLF